MSSAPITADTTPGSAGSARGSTDFTEAELQTFREALADADCGHVVLRGFFDEAAIDRYREECAAFMSRGRVIHTRMNRADLPDYVHPRTAPRTDGSKRRDAARGPDTWRIYQYLNNAHSPETAALFERVLTLRDALEQPWLQAPTWRAEHEVLFDYVQVTHYVDDCEGLPRHHDTEKNLPHPLLQPLIMLSRPGRDYRGGDLRVWTRSGRSLSMERDAGLAKGDLLFFDRALDHEVAPSEPVPGAIGRWAVVIGARDRRCGSWLDRVTYGDFWHRRVKPWQRKLRRKLGLGKR